MTRLLVALLFGCLFVPAVARAQSANELLDKGIHAYSVREYDGGAWLLRRALAVEGGLTSADAARALMYLTAIEVARNQRDSAMAVARRLIVVDPKFRPDENTFPPNVIAVVQDARRTSPSVSIRAPGDTEIRPGSDVFVVRLGSASAPPPEVTAVVMGADGRTVRSLYTGTIRDSVDVRWNGLDASGNTPAAGRYSIVVTPSSRDRSAGGSRGSWTLRLPLELTRPSVDTTPMPPAPPDSVFRPERGDYNSAWHALAPGLVAGGAVLLLPKLIASGEHPSGARLIVGGTIAIAGVAAFFSHHPGRTIPANERYNRNLRETWKRNAAEIARRNADRMRQARLVIRPGAPSLTTSAGDTP
jgi:hypothetical protein